MFIIAEQIAEDGNERRNIPAGRGDFQSQTDNDNVASNTDSQQRVTRYRAEKNAYQQATDTTNTATSSAQASTQIPVDE